MERNRDSFLFWLDKDPGLVLPPRPEKPNRPDKAALSVLTILLTELRAKGFVVSEPKFNKTGQACSTAHLPGCVMNLILGIMRSEHRAFVWLWTREGRLSTAGESQPKLAKGESAAEKFRETISAVLSEEVGAKSLQRLGEQEGDRVWREYEKMAGLT